MPAQCKVCNKNITPKRDRGISCVTCDKWYHQSCSGLSVEEFEKLIKQTDLRWNCNQCQKAKKGRRSSFIVPQNSPATTSKKVLTSRTDSPLTSSSLASSKTNNLSEIWKRIELVEKQLKKQEEENSSLRDLIERLQQSISDLSIPSHSSEKILEIRNLPPSALENPTEIALLIGENIGCEINAIDVTCEASLDSKSVLSVAFESTNKRSEFLIAGKRFNREGGRFLYNGQRIKIFVNEKLTSQQKRLHYKASIISKSRGFKFCWWCNGELLVKKSENHLPIAIKDEQHLEQFFSQADALLSECSRPSH